MNPRLYTTKQAATNIGLSPRTVERWAMRFGFQKIGRDYLLTRDQMEQIRAANHEPGRPPKD